MSIKKKERKAVNYKLSLLSSLFGHIRPRNPHISDSFLSLSLSLLSLEASIDVQCSLPFYHRPTTKTLHAPDAKQGKLPVKHCLKSQLPSTRVQAGKDRQSFHLRHCFLTITRRSFVLSSQG